MLRTLKRLLFPVLNALGPLLIILAAAQLLPIAIAYRDGENVLSEFLLLLPSVYLSACCFFFRPSALSVNSNPETDFYW